MTEATGPTLLATGLVLIGSLCGCELLCGGRGLQSVSAAEWQWSVPVEPMPERASLGETPRAFLWIPSGCREVRGIVVGQHNMEEQPILEHPAFRKTLAEIGFAEIWIAPWFDGFFRFDEGVGERFDAMLAALAVESGYGELTQAPLVPMGHSAAASFPWCVAAWKPERTLACVSVSGQWPYWLDEKNAPHVIGRSIDTVPGIVTVGEYEWANDRMKDGLAARGKHPRLPLTGVGCPADGHFNVTDEKVELLALYLKKAAEYRLVESRDVGRPPSLAVVDPETSGWLVDRYRAGKKPAGVPAPVGAYEGTVAEAFWCFDEQLARAVDTFQQQHRGKPTLVGYVQDGGVIPQDKNTHQQVTIAFRPEDDGCTFPLDATFLETVPEGRPERWTGQKAGEVVHLPANATSPLTIERITGPIRHLGGSRWTLDFNRGSWLGDRRRNEAWLVAVWPGDDVFKRALQQARLAVPTRNDKGAKQVISFEQPVDMVEGDEPQQLRATSSAGLPVRFTVREGPAEMKGDMLHLTDIPVRARMPILVTVVAWQFGRATEPRVQTAETVVRTLRVNSR